jgi:hypothetical protein
MNLNSRNLNRSNSIAIDLNYYYIGIYVHTLFSGTRSTQKLEGIFFNKSFFQRSINKFFLTDY